ncbi:MAG: protein kinase [Cyanothece sp. SIO1E1]|nr:protein kinase [Cyanothece sp. SIO1E1]
MSYCLNQDCPNPENLTHTELCQACGSKLLLRDRYSIIRSLGQGGFGATFLSQDQALPGNPYCVIKQLRPATSASHVLAMARDLFKREASTLGKIGNHPQLPRLLDYFEANSEFYLVQEYISGANLQQEVKQRGPFSEAGVKQFLSEILPMMQYVHNQQVIHRDIKPANIIRRTEDKRLVLIDFGAVKDKIDPIRAKQSDQTALTAYAIGTPGYAPPEQMAMRPVYASDLYALGVTCVYLLTSKSPKDFDYDPVTGEMVWFEHVHVSEHFAGVLKKMLEVSVRHRYQSAGDILRALDLEPYLDSLAQNMAVQSDRPAQPYDITSPPTSSSADLSSPVVHSSPSGRLARSIRDRRARSASKNSSEITGLYTGGFRRRSPINQHPSMTTVPTPSLASQQPRKLTKIDAENLRIAYLKGRRDFSHHDLSQVSLQRADLIDANFNQSKLIRTNLQGASLAKVNFGRATLNYAILRDADLGRAYFANANLQETDLRGADLSYAHLTNANLRGANFCGANLTNAKVTREQLALARTNWLTIYPSGRRGSW